MRFWTSRFGAPIGMLLLAASAAAAPAGPPLVTPALLSMNNLTTAAAPELRVVASALSSRDLERSTRTMVAPGGVRLATSRAFVTRGVEALARYSASRADQSPTPWEEGIRAPESADRGHDPLTIAGSTSMHVLNTDGVPGSVSFDALRTIDPHTGTWSASASRRETSLESIGETSTLSIVRKLAHAASPVLEMADALRAVRLNQVSVGDGLTLKLDGRTGRHARCFAVLTQRF